MRKIEMYAGPIVKKLGSRKKIGGSRKFASNEMKIMITKFLVINNCTCSKKNNKNIVGNEE